MTAIVLVHGWGYDASVWDAVRARLDPSLEVSTVDLGFFSHPHVKVGVTEVNPFSGTDETALAVGHSLGALWWLTQGHMPWRRLLCINGFPRFTEAPDYAPAVAPRVLARMREQFAKAPLEVLAAFHARCGAPGPQAAPDHARLAAGLGWLAEWDGRAALAARCQDVFALAGTDDPIVPEAMTRMAFAALPAGHLEYADTAGHALPRGAPDLCARWIERLAA